MPKHQCGDPLRTVRFKSSFYNVRPRYSPGSPAMVDERQAMRTAAIEKEFYEYALSGTWGDDWVEKAKELGLSGIVEQYFEEAKHWHIHDLITGETSERPFTSR